jgi:hypothetical protein
MTLKVGQSLQAIVYGAPEKTILYPPPPLASTSMKPVEVSPHSEIQGDNKKESIFADIERLDKMKGGVENVNAQGESAEEPAAANHKGMSGGDRKKRTMFLRKRAELMNRQS